MKIVEKNKGFELYLQEKCLIRHTFDNCAIYVGYGEERMAMYRGNFEVEDYVIERTPLKYYHIHNNHITFKRYEGDSCGALKLSLIEKDNRLSIYFIQCEAPINRIWIRLHADKDEKVYGCGEQMSYFNLRGRHFPLWTSEPGVGRDKSTYVTWLADTRDKAGGDYYTTNYPEPTFISTNKYWCHVETTAYADFNFQHDDFHELQVWDIPKSIIFETGKTYLELTEKFTDYAGRLPKLPNWTRDGVILGVQGGTDQVSTYLDQALESGIKVSGLWCQDWEGINRTSFGKRLRWNWEWDPKRYPGLDKFIITLKEKGIRMMGYINPYVVNDGGLYAYAKEKGYLATRPNGDIYDVDFGEFYCGIVDFTYPNAFEWYKDVIKKNLIDLGLGGWMADFGEYLPIDCCLKNGVPAMLMHNAWPALWAKCNYEAIEESGKIGEVFYFMRAGGHGLQRYCTALWAGDQSVDWSLHDGLASVLPAALSSGILGNPYHHSDIGGYTSLHGNIRTKELFQRWTEMAVFTSLMRTHEGNRPEQNFQYYDDDETIKHLAKMTAIHVALKPYIDDLMDEAVTKGLPLQRPLFMHYERDKKVYDIQYAYLFGKDILVAPVYEPNKTEWSVYLPEDDWIHFWTGSDYKGGDHVIDAPIGFPPVFYRKKSQYAQLFKMVANHNRF